MPHETHSRKRLREKIEGTKRLPAAHDPFFSRAGGRQPCQEHSDAHEKILRAENSKPALPRATLPAPTRDLSAVDAREPQPPPRTILPRPLRAPTLTITGSASNEWEGPCDVVAAFRRLEQHGRLPALAAQMSPRGTFPAFAMMSTRSRTSRKARDIPTRLPRIPSDPLSLVPLPKAPPRPISSSPRAYKRLPGMWASCDGGLPSASEAVPRRYHVQH